MRQNEKVEAETIINEFWEEVKVIPAVDNLYWQQKSAVNLWVTFRTFDKGALFTFFAAERKLHRRLRRVSINVVITDIVAPAVLKETIPADACSMRG